MGYAPPEYVDGPSRIALPYGLFSVVSLAEAATERWENGIEWDASCFEPLNVVVGDCDDPEGFPKQFPDGGPGTGSATAFTVYGVYKCSPIGNPLEYAQTRARDALLAREEQSVEGRLWAKIAADTPTILAPASPDVIKVLGVLEKFIADTYGSLGVIHASRNAATSWVQKGLVRRHGGRLETELGTPVIAGGGYPGTSTTGAAPAAGTEWVAATPALMGYRSEVFEASDRPGDLLDRATNDLYGIAERNYLIGYEPCGVALAALPLGCC